MPSEIGFDVTLFESIGVEHNLKDFKKAQGLRVSLVVPQVSNDMRGVRRIGL